MAVQLCKFSLPAGIGNAPTNSPLEKGARGIDSLLHHRKSKR